MLLLPAAETLRPGLPRGCAPESFAADAACAAGVFASANLASLYPNLYLTYLATLSTNTSMVVMPGGHDFTMRAYKETAAQLLAKFAGA